MDKAISSEVDRPRRLIKRYSNRKLYDTRDSRYVTLHEIGGMVRDGEEVQIIDNATKEDKTEATLALILSEDLKTGPRSVPLGALRDLIQERSEKLLSQLRGGPIGRLIPGSSDEPSEPTATPPAADERGSRLTEIVESSRQTLDSWQQAIDERIRAVLPRFGLFRDLQSEVRALEDRVRVLERRLASEGELAQAAAEGRTAPPPPTHQPRPKPRAETDPQGRAEARPVLDPGPVAPRREAPEAE